LCGLDRYLVSYFKRHNSIIILNGLSYNLCVHRLPVCRFVVMYLVSQFFLAGISRSVTPSTLSTIHRLRLCSDYIAQLNHTQTLSATASRPFLPSFPASRPRHALQPVTEPSAHGREFSSACAVFVYERDSRTVRSIQSRRLRKHDLDSQMLPTRCPFWHRRATACSAIIENRCARPSSWFRRRQAVDAGGHYSTECTTLSCPLGHPPENHRGHLPPGTPTLTPMKRTNDNNPSPN